MPAGLLVTMLWAVRMGRPLVARSTMRLGLRHRGCAKAQCERGGDGISEALKLHGATFLSEKDSSPNGCHGPMMQEKPR